MLSWSKDDKYQFYTLFHTDPTLIHNILIGEYKKIIYISIKRLTADQPPQFTKARLSKLPFECQPLWL